MSNVKQFFITQPNCVVTTGDIMPLTYDGVTRVGYLPCDGTAFAFDGDYSLLYSIIGYTYGQSGTDFRVPDLRGMWIRGWDGLYSATLGTQQADAYQSHVHTYNIYSAGGFAQYGLTPSNTSTAFNTFPIAGDNNDSGNTETRPRSLTVNWAIRYI